MKLRRFTEAGVEAVRKALHEVEKAGDLAPATALLSREDLTEDIPALADIDLDETRTFDTTFAFCEYFHSLIKDHSPLRYRTDSGFWTWLAVVYLPQLVKSNDENFRIGDRTRYIPNPNSYRDYYRHLLVGAYMIYAQYDQIGKAQACKTLLWKPLDTYGDVYEQVASRQWAVQNPAIIELLNRLYFDERTQRIKPGAGGPNPGTARRLIYVLDQFGMTRDFFEMNDVEEMLTILPHEFDKFNPLRMS